MLALPTDENPSLAWIGATIDAKPPTNKIDQQKNARASTSVFEANTRAL